MARLLRRRGVALVVVGLVLAFAISWLDHAQGVLPVDDDWHRYHGQRFEVVRVIDGDTLDIRIPDGDSAVTRIRLWGVDTPELAKPNGQEPAERGAEQALLFTRDRVQGRRVTVYLQPQRPRGKYGRLLAYIETQDGADLAAELIEAGLGKADGRWGHDRSARYEALELQARSGQRGVWAKKKK